MSNRKSDEEIDDLMDDIDELEDVDAETPAPEEEDPEEVEEEDDEEDPDEAPVKSRSKRSSKSKSAAKKPTEGIGTREVAEAAGVEPRILRAFLRNKGYQPRDDREGRYNWKSLNDPEVKQILKRIRDGELKAQQKAQLEKVKGKKSTKKKASA